MSTPPTDSFVHQEDSPTLVLLSGNRVRSPTHSNISVGKGGAVCSASVFAWGLKLRGGGLFRFVIT